MNYIKLYDIFINYCKNTEVNIRIKNRNKIDFRLENKYIYLENHHIIPKHDDGQDIKDNMVLLLPEEHIMAHKIRWKALKQRGDMLAVRFCLNGIKNPKNKEINEIKNNLLITKSLRQGYIWIKQNSAEVRKTHGWQTKDGVKRISEARKGTMPVKDLEGKMIGSVSINHHKVLSGEWVHHSKGIKLSKEEAMKKANPGEKNGKYSGITDEEIYTWHLELTNKLQLIPSINILREYVKYKYGKEIPKSFTEFRFKKGKYEMDIIENKTGMTYNPYIRGNKAKELKLKLEKIYND